MFASRKRLPFNVDATVISAALATATPNASIGSATVTGTITIGARDLPAKPVLPSGFHRIRHYGLFANGGRTENLARARQLLAMPAPEAAADADQSVDAEEPLSCAYPCPCCGGPMIIIETFEPGHPPRAPPQAKADRP